MCAKCVLFSLENSDSQPLDQIGRQAGRQTEIQTYRQAGRQAHAVTYLLGNVVEAIRPTPFILRACAGQPAQMTKKKGIVSEE